MKRIVIGVIVLTGLLVGQLDAHPCNAAAIQRKDIERIGYPSLAFDMGSVSPPKITDQTYMTFGGGPVKISEIQWTSWSYMEFVDETPKGWSQCEAGIFEGFTAQISIGGGFNLVFPVTAIVGFSINLPQSQTLDLTSDVIPPEKNHEFQFVEYEKKGTVMYTGTEYTWRVDCKLKCPNFLDCECFMPPAPE